MSVSNKYGAIILVGGLPGSGKSYFAKKLTEELNAIYISSDRVRKAIGSMGKYSFEKKNEVYKHMLQQSETILHQGGILVIDATFYRKQLIDMFINLSAKMAVPLFFILIYADEYLIKKRLKTHRKDSEAGLKVYYELKKQFEQIEIHHLRLRSTNENIDEMLKEAEDFIKASG